MTSGIWCQLRSIYPNRSYLVVYSTRSRLYTWIFVNDLGFDSGDINYRVGRLWYLSHLGCFSVFPSTELRAGSAPALAAEALVLCLGHSSPGDVLSSPPKAPSSLTSPSGGGVTCQSTNSLEKRDKLEEKEGLCPYVRALVTLQRLVAEVEGDESLYN